MSTAAYKFSRVKSLIVFLAAFSIIAPLFGQAPQAFKYQAVIRNTDGTTINNNAVSLRISILKGNPAGNNAVFVEVHNVETGFNGLVSLNIGMGNHIGGEFDTIDWSSGQYHIKIELKIGTGNFVAMGVSQLLSVPFALNAEESRLTSGIKSLPWSEIQNLQNPQPGSMYFASDSLKVALYNGSGWFFFEPCPPVNQANAGSYYHCVCAPFTLPHNPPGEGNCFHWEIVNYPHLTNDSAYFIYTHNDSMCFYGQPGVAYKLKKSNFNHCENSTDTVTVLFEYLPTLPDAGEDRFNVDGTEVTLAGNELQTEREIGKWIIVSGTGGEFPYGDTIPNAVFRGVRNQMYKLAWTITNACNLTYYDYVQVSFCPLMVQANAGSSVNNKCSPFQLQANPPGPGNTGTWAAIPGVSCSFSDIHDPLALFFGEAGQTYQLTWKISNVCDTTFSTITVQFAAVPTVPNAGVNQLNVENTFTTLDANCPIIGTGFWSVLTGSDGSFQNPGYCKSKFYGQPNQLYMLEWRISNNCFSNAKTVLVSFFNCGSALFDDRDDYYNPKAYPTVTVGSQCWMAKNLNVGTIIYTAQKNNGVIEKFCFDNEPDSCNVYGGLYMWDEMMGYPDINPGAKDICLPGWHIPLLTEINTLVNGLGTSPGGKLKEIGERYWTNNYNATNNYGFSAYGGGIKSTFFSAVKADGRFWMATTSGTNAYNLRLRATTDDVTTPTLPKNNSVSVRCIKN